MRERDGIKYLEGAKIYSAMALVKRTQDRYGSIHTKWRLQDVGFSRALACTKARNASTEELEALRKRAESDPH